MTLVASGNRLLVNDLKPSFDEDDPAYDGHIDGDFPLFYKVVRILKTQGQTHIVRARQHGNHCSWFLIGHVQCKDSNGATKDYFIKYGAGKNGEELLDMEYHAEQNLYSFLPDNVPRPIAWGDLGLREPHKGTFLLTEFVRFDDRSLPDVEATGALVAKLHNVSAGTSNRFGTSKKTFDGLLFYLEGWEAKWQVLFAKILYQIYHYNTLSNGRDDELDIAVKKIIWYVLPRLLDAVDKAGKIKPCFIHGDLWNGNFGHAASDSKRLYIFDGSGYYAHNEMELAYWNTKHHGMHKKWPEYRDAYSKHRPPSHPVGEFDDRITLYTLKPCLLYSAMMPGHITRQRALDNMKYLLHKYGPTGTHRHVDPIYKEITDGKHLWVKTYTPEIARYIETRRGLDVRVRNTGN